MKILGIGNAIVDVLCKVTDDFLTQNSLTKSTMKLVDEKEFNNLISSLKIEETISGGSVANSIVGLSHLKNDVAFIGKINDDTFGKMYEESLILKDVNYYYEKKKEEFPTGVCIVLITPDAERTMCTHLGVAGKISEKDILKYLNTKTDFLTMINNIKPPNLAFHPVSKDVNNPDNNRENLIDQI